jgi:SAM-dependent methyltransferase
MKMKPRSDDTRVETGSFRDPSGFVFYHNDEVYRCVDDASWAVLSELQASGLLKKCVDSYHLVPSRLLDGDEAKEIQQLFEMPSHFVWHEKLDVVTYPYEWSFSMLLDAAVMHLKLQKKLVENQWSLKDATAFNVMFRNSEPVFIDLASIEKPVRLDIWNAYGQFCKMFLYPIMLFRDRGIQPKQIFQSGIEGMDVDQAYRQLGFFKSIAPGRILDVYLQRRLNKHTFEQNKAVKQRLETKNTKNATQLVNLDRLIRKISGFRKKTRARGIWHDYQADNSYSDAARDQKHAYIESFLAAEKPATVLDLGCNTGEYSRLAVEAGARVISIDSDHDSVDHLYVLAKKNKWPIQTILADLTNPPPDIGFMNRERKALMKRVSGDCVFALALIHHLHITGRIPLEGIAGMFAQLSNRFLIVEYIDREDAMFQTLLSLREDIYQDMNVERFKAAFAGHFELRKEEKLNHTNRYMFTYEKRVRPEA